MVLTTLATLLGALVIYFEIFIRTPGRRRKRNVSTPLWRLLTEESSWAKSKWG